MTLREKVWLVVLVVILVGLFTLLFVGCPRGVCLWL